MTEQEVAFPIEGQEILHDENMQQHLRWLQWNWNSKETSTETPSDRKWWEFWKIDESRKTSLLVIGRYLLEGLDDFIRIAKSKGDPLAFKATIMSTMETLYDSVMGSAKLPWWLKPFGGSLKTLVLNVVISLLIDYIVGHYEKGQFA